MRKSVYLYLLICMMVCCAESLKADNVYLQEMAVPDFSMADELFKPKVQIGNQGRISYSYHNRSAQANSIVVVKKEKYAYKSLGTRVWVGESAVTSYGKVNESVYLAQISVMSTFNMEGAYLDEAMLRASPPPGGGPGTGELVSIDNEVPILLLLLLGYCVWLWKGKKAFK